MAEGKSGDFKITQEEATRLRNAFKEPEFRKLFFDYAKEISDPENKKRNEEELIALEKQRGVDMKYIHPKPGFVIKSFLLPENTRKIFINVCHSEVVSPATTAPGRTRTERRRKGQHWSVPYSLTPPREDLDKAKNKCTVVDAVFNPKTLEKGKESPGFKKMLIDTVFDGLKEQLKLNVNREKVIFLQMAYKGTPVPTVIRTKMQTPPESPDNNPLNIPFPPLKEQQGAKPDKKEPAKEKPTSEPSYTLVHRGEFSMQDYTNDRESTLIRRPRELVVTVQLPGVESAGVVELDIFERKMTLQCGTPVYKLDLVLPFPIDEEKGMAKFDRVKKTLTVTLPVLPPIKVSSLSQTSTSQETMDKKCREEIEEKRDISSKDVSNVGDISNEGNVSNEGDVSNKGDVSNEGDISNGDVGNKGDVSNKGDIKQDNKEDNSREPSNEEEQNDNVVSPNSKDTPISLVETRPAKAPPSIEDRPQTNLEDATAPTRSTARPPPSVANVQAVSSKWVSAGDWLCPPFSYRQEDTIVVFCLHTPGVKPKSLVKFFEDHSVQLTYSTLTGHEGYSFYVSFPESCSLDVDDCSIDISEDNIVLVLRKDTPAAADDDDGETFSTWERFSVGLNSSQTTEKLFLTESNVESVIEKIEDLPDPWKEKHLWSSATTVSATLSADKDRLDIAIKDPGKEDSVATNGAITEEGPSEETTGSSSIQRVSSSHVNGTVDGATVEEVINGDVAISGPAATVATSSPGTDATTDATSGPATDSGPATSEPAVMVNEDGSVFIQGGEDYSQNREAIISALAGGSEDTSPPVASKVKFSNTLLYSLD